MKNWLISKTAITTAKVGDDKELKHVYPIGVMVISVKLFVKKKHVSNEN